jgi:hypothetical protein
LAFDAELACSVLSEQVESDAVEDREVLRGVSGSFAVQVFCEANIEGPVQLVFDAPVVANGLVQARRVEAEAGV